MMKKIINLSLAVVLSLQSVQAASILDNALTNYTAANSITIKDKNGNNVKSMYYSGGYYFRFMGGYSPQPVWGFAPPEIQAGCSGLNLKGMFVSLLGLDQFGAMLQNAGASLAWGIAIGLVYSLPGVGNVFKMINQWAHDLQKLLGMSCQAGIAIGQAIAHKTGIDTKKNQDLLLNGYDSNTVAKTLQEGVKSTVDAMGLSTIDFSWENGFNYVGNPEKLESQKNEMLSVPLSKIFADVSVGGAIMNNFILSTNGSSFRNAISDLIDNHYSNNSKVPIFTKKIVLKYSGPTNFAGTGPYALVAGSDVLSNAATPYSGGLTNSIETRESIGLKLLSYTLFYNMVGDIGYPDHSLKQTVDRFETEFAKYKSSNSGTKAEGDKGILDFMTNPSSLWGEQSLGVINAAIPDKVSFKNFILNGSYGDPSIPTKPLIAPAFSIIATKEAQKNQTNFMLVPTNNENNELYFDGITNYPGAKMLSKCIIYNSLKDKIKPGLIEGLQKIDNTDNSIDCSSYRHLKVARMEYYANVLRNSELSDIQDGIEKLKEFYTYALTNAILDQMVSNLYVSKLSNTKIKSANSDADSPGSGSPVVEPSKGEVFSSATGKSLMESRIKKFTDEIATLKKELKAEFKPTNTEGMSVIVDHFNKQNDRNKEKVSSSQQ